jgi:hypothetical protein
VDGPSFDLLAPGVAGLGEFDPDEKLKRSAVSKLSMRTADTAS